MLSYQSRDWSALLGESMVFDPCPEKLTQLILKAGTVIRELKGLPEETNITILYNETAPMLGIVVVPLDSRVVNHLPRPDEMRDEDGTFIIPNKPCPKCGKLTFLSSICPGCKDAEGGKYKSGYTCDEKNGGCGFVDDKMGEWITQRLSRMGVEIQTGSKKSFGIKTITDEGLK